MNRRKFIASLFLAPLAPHLDKLAALLPKPKAMGGVLDPKFIYCVGEEGQRDFVWKVEHISKIEIKSYGEFRDITSDAISVSDFWVRFGK